MIANAASILGEGRAGFARRRTGRKHSLSPSSRRATPPICSDLIYDRDTGHPAVPVEDAGDQIIIGDENQLADGGEHVGGDAVAVSAAGPRQAQFGMNAAHPMDQENDL